jgi:hypothetical protein
MDLWKWFSDFRRGPSVEGTATYEAPPHTAPLVVPALGDVFDLHVIVHLKWSCDSLDDAELEKLALEWRDGALYIVGRVVGDCARSLDPLQPARAQAVINGSEGIRNGLCYRDDRHMITCRPSVQVLMDPRLREQLLPFEQQRVELTQQHQLDTQRDIQMRKRAEDWLQALQTLEHFDHLGKDERQFLLRYAASLVDSEFAEVIGRMANDRHVRYTHFAEVLERASRDHERLGLFEFASAYDKSLQTFCRQMGVNPASFLMSDFGAENPPQERVP